MEQNTNNFNVINLNNKTSEQISMILEKGIYNDKIFMCFKNNYYIVQINNVRCFKFSVKRAKNSLLVKSSNEINKLFIKSICNIDIEKYNDNLFYLTIKNLTLAKIKLKEISDFISFKKTDSSEIIIKKQNEKIQSLLDRIKLYEEKYENIDTDDEMFILF